MLTSSKSRVTKTLALAVFSQFLSFQTFAFDTWWHAECTRKAMVANGFSADARLATQVSNYLTDFLAVLNMPNEELTKVGIQSIRFRSDHSYDFLHFDAVFTEADIEKNWELILDNTIGLLKKYSAGWIDRTRIPVNHLLQYHWRQPSCDPGFLFSLQLG